MVRTVCGGFGLVQLGVLLSGQRHDGILPAARNPPAPGSRRAGRPYSARGSGQALLAVSLGRGSALSAFLGTLPALLRARRSPTSVEITLADGRSTKVTADSAEDARTLLEAAMREHVNPPQP
ncbi:MULTISPECIES: hypothetical protein [Streptomyces]|uniref:effector-associated constant component EACC1 n=1 Tax=Streptomyces TaxID=1883 RepID=UPI002E8115EA|nr:hypothetical protein [Streptomyces murinus]WUD04707.1 hypothetical protein OG586_00005 [Streptomyces murinus]WUD11520.1 hypothetical protein OG586_37445 [Streptomyces murinus]